MDTPKRIVWVDYMKALSMMCVVLYHTQIQADVKTLSNIIALPAFFFVSAFFTNTELDFFPFWKKKTLRLLIPYIFFGIFSWVAWLFIGRKFGADAEVNKEWWSPLMGLLIGDVRYLIQNRPLWFICCMISMEWLYYLLSRITHPIVRWSSIVGIGISGCVLARYGFNMVWEITAAMIVLPVYALGSTYGKRLMKKTQTYKTTLLVLLLLVSAAGVTIGYFFNPKIHIAMCQVGNPALFYITTLAVVGFWFSVAVLVERVFGTLPFLTFIGQNTLLILCTHIPLFGLIKGLLMICHIPLSFYSTNIGSLTLWGCSLILSLPLVYALKRFFPFLK